MAQLPSDDVKQIETLERQAADLRKQLKTEIGRGSHPPQSWWSVTDAMTISTAVLAFGIIVVLVASFLIRKENDGMLVLKTLATILILTFTVFLIVAGYSDQQIAPAIGLLGTIAGYLLGKETLTKRESSPKERL